MCVCARVSARVRACMCECVHRCCRIEVRERRPFIIGNSSVTFAVWWLEHMLPGGVSKNACAHAPTAPSCCPVNTTRSSRMTSASWCLRTSTPRNLPPSAGSRACDPAACARRLRLPRSLQRLLTPTRHGVQAHEYPTRLNTHRIGSSAMMARGVVAEGNHTCASGRNLSSGCKQRASTIARRAADRAHTHAQGRARALARWPCRRCRRRCTRRSRRRARRSSTSTRTAAATGHAVVA